MEPGPFVHSAPPEEEMLMRLRSPYSHPLDPETLGKQPEASIPTKGSNPAHSSSLLPGRLARMRAQLVNRSTVHLPSPMRILHSRNHHRPCFQTQ